MFYSSSSNFHQEFMREVSTLISPKEQKNVAERLAGQQGASGLLLMLLNLHLSPFVNSLTKRKEKKRGSGNRT
jgi:hypothetical protein